MTNRSQMPFDSDSLPETSLGLLYEQRQMVIRELERCVDEFTSEIGRLRAENWGLCGQIARLPQELDIQSTITP